MTTDIEMLPLPEHIEAGKFPFDAHVFEHNMDMVSYARAVAEHNVKKRDAEIETLRAALAATKAHKENATMSRDGVIQALSEARDELGAEVHRLRAELEIEKGQAERLAEALVALEAWIVDYVPDDVGGRGAELAALRAALRDHDQEGNNVKE